jgi:uncharacterized protein (TIGR02266 family)
MAESENRRVYPRIALEVEVDLQSEHNFYTGFTQNISAGGLFVSTASVMHLGDTALLRLTLPGNVRVEAHAVVRWVREQTVSRGMPPGMGMQFLDLTPEARQAIEAFVNQRETIFHPDDDDL